jgi:hypothetical protein
MKLQTLILTGALAVLACSHEAFAQKSQPWKTNWGSVDSRVRFCPTGAAQPIPLPRLAFDDFICTNTGPINWLYWWGVVLDPNQAQLKKKYYIAIHANATAGQCPFINNQPCNVGQRLAWWCVTPTYKYIGLDCHDRKVYRFRATLNPSFTQTAGTHYWLTIAEIDEESARLNVEDFRWSGFRLNATNPTQFCPAQQLPPVLCNISDDCPNPTDLSFDLKRKLFVGGILVNPGILKPGLFTWELRPATAGLNDPALWTETIETDDDSSYAVDVEVPDGEYRVTIQGMGIGRAENIVAVQGDQPTVADFAALHSADLNNDGKRDGQDISIIVDGLLNP